MRSEEDRQAIYEALCAGVGQRAAEAVMEMLDRIDRIMLAQEGGAAALRGELAEARAETRAISAKLQGEMAELRGEIALLTSALSGEMSDLREELAGDMAGLRVELKGDIARLTGDMAELRVELKGDIARLERRIDKLVPTIVVAHIASMVGFASLLLGVARFT